MARIPTGLPGYWRTIVRVIFLPVRKPAGYMIIIQEAGQKKGTAGAVPRIPKARCPMPDARCPMPDARCPMPD